MDDQMADEFDPEESLSQDPTPADPRLNWLNDLPSPEEIYDLDTDTLTKLLDCIASRQAEAESESAAFRRLKRLRDVIQLELDERLISADFEQNCMEVLNSWQQTVDIAQDLIKDDDNPNLDRRTPAQRPHNLPETPNTLGTASTPSSKPQTKRQQLPPLPHSELLSTRRPPLSADVAAESLDSRSNLQSTHNSSKESGQTLFPASWEHAGLRTVKTGGAKKNDWKDFVKQTLGGTKLASTTVTVGIGAKRPPKPTVRRSDSTSDTSNDQNSIQSNRRGGNLSSNSTQSSMGSIPTQVSIPRHKTEADSDPKLTENYPIRFRRGLAGIASKSPMARTGGSAEQEEMNLMPSSKGKFVSSKSSSHPPKDVARQSSRPTANATTAQSSNPASFVINKGNKSKSIGAKHTPQQLQQKSRPSAAPSVLLSIEAEALSSVVAVCSAMEKTVSCTFETSGYVLRYIAPPVLEPVCCILEEAAFKHESSSSKSAKSATLNSKRADAKVPKTNDKPSSSLQGSSRMQGAKGLSIDKPAKTHKAEIKNAEETKNRNKKASVQSEIHGDGEVKDTQGQAAASPVKISPNGVMGSLEEGLAADSGTKTKNQLKSKDENKLKPKAENSSNRSKSDQAKPPKANDPTTSKKPPAKPDHPQQTPSTKSSDPKPKPPSADLLTPIYNSDPAKTPSQTPAPPSKATKDPTIKGFARLPDPKKPSSTNSKKPQTQTDEEHKTGSSRTMNLTAGSGFGHNPYNQSLGSTQAVILPDSALGGVCHDYTHIIPTWAHLFSEFYTNPGEIDLSATMRDILQQYMKHVEVMKRMDSRLLEIAFSLSPLEYGMHDLIYKQDKNKLLGYISKTCIKWETYRNRQEVYLKTLDHCEDVEEVENEDESDLEELAEPGAALVKPANTQPHRQKQFFRVVKSKTEVYDIITKSFYRRQGWRELPHGLNLGATWNLLWAWGKVQVDLKKVLVFQKINHFSNIKHIGRKDNLKRSLERLMSMNTANQRFFNILPDSYNIPRDYSAFATASVTMREQEPDKEQVWIVKPAASSRGRGIYLIKSYLDLSYSESVVVQRYVTNPLLLDGYKFDLRIYVLVTSFQPLEVFLYKEGFARFASEKFTLDTDELENKFVHLTNYSIQKHHYLQKQSNQDSQTYFEDNGSKLTLTRLKAKLKNMNLSFDVIWEQIKLLILKSLVAAQPNIKQQPNSFELLGYDVLIDQNLHCWLLEVNCSPSLHKEHMIDEVIKQTLIDDIIDLVDPPDFDHHRLQEILARRIGEEQRHKSKISIHNNTKETLNRDLTYILKGKKLRRVGELPTKMGCFEMIAPTEMSEKVESFARGQPLKKPSGPAAVPTTVSAS